MGRAASPRERACAGSLVLKLLSLSCRWGILGKVSGDSFRRIFISSSGVSFQSLQFVLAKLTRFCRFSGPGAEIQLRPRCYLWRGDLSYLVMNGAAIVFS